MTLRFLEGGGSMGAMLRSMDGARSALGWPIDWPITLRSLVGIMLSAPQPMFLVWGKDQLMVYNDGYKEILGGHHPALGKPFAQVWAEVLDQVGPIMARAYDGQPTYMDDIELVLHRHGHPEEAHFSFFYTPVRAEGGDVVGVFCACTETTRKIAAQRSRVQELERLRDMFELSPSFVAVLRGPNHEFELTNAAFLQLTAERNVIGKPVRQALPELAEQGFFELLDMVYATGQPFKGEAMPITIQRIAGEAPSLRYVDFIYQPMRDPDGSVAGIFVEGVDLTTSYEQARVLRESEEKFRTFAQVVPNHVWAAPPEGMLDWFNDQTLAYTGLTSAELLAAGWRKLLHADDVKRAAAAWANALATGSNYEIEFRLRRADGVYRWHLARALPIRDAEGAIVRWIGTNTDIEDQRSDREALVHLNASLERRVDERTREKERIWRNSPDLMAVLSVDGTFEDINPAWARVLGWEPRDVVGKSIAEMIHPLDILSAESALSQASVGVLPRFECRFVHRDSGYRTIAWTAAPEGGALFAFGRDVTAEHAQKLALEQAEEQLRQSQKMEAIGQLTGGIAHDFNNMLASIYGSIQLMQRKVSAGKFEGLESLLERAATSSQRAAALTQRLLAFARRQPLNIQRVEIAPLVESLEDMMMRTLGPKMTLNFVFGADLWPARIDAGQLETALLNLVINARDAMPEGGQLTIEAQNFRIDSVKAASLFEVGVGDYVALRVTDTGAGMPANVSVRAFEPFFTTKPIGQGTGLGLSMVYGFVKQAGGHVGIKSEIGKGTTISLFLPRELTLAAPASPPQPTPTPTPIASPPADADKTILVVEDDEAVRGVIAAVLADLGYPFIETAEAKTALAVIDSGRQIDLLVTDVGLPGMNGRQLAEIAMARKPGLKVLFVTGYAEQAAQRQGFLTDGMQMITKPFVITELASRIRSILVPDKPLEAGSTK